MTSSDKRGVTPSEMAVLELTASLWNALCELGDHHPSDMAEHERDVHSIQNRVMARVARRANPDFFR